MRSTLHITASAALLLVLATGCAPLASQAPAAPPTPPVATIQELMDSLVDPLADAVWDAVSTEVTAAGETERVPRTDAEWAAVRRQALGLVEAARLLAEPGRRVAAEGRAVEDAHISGVLSGPQADQKIAGDPARFAAFAQNLQAAAQQAVAAIDARDANRLLQVGAQLEAACEHCHQTYWYPGDQRPSAAQWPAPFERPALAALVTQDLR